MSHARASLLQRARTSLGSLLLLAFVASLFTWLTIRPVSAVESLASLQVTISNPAGEEYTNVSYTFQPTVEETVDCDDANAGGHDFDCLVITAELDDFLSPSTSQEWATSSQSWVSANDIQLGAGFTEPGLIVATTTVENVTPDNGDTYELLTIKIRCDETAGGSNCGAVTWDDATTYTLTIINDPLMNPASPVTGTYNSHTHTLKYIAYDSNVALNTGYERDAVTASGGELNVSATVDALLTFSFAGVNTGVTFYDVESTTNSQSSTACNFGSLTPGEQEICLLTLTLTTNAVDGATIYVVQDNDMTSNGNTVKQFANGTRVDDADDTYWSSPSAAAQGHLGYSSDDTDVFPATSTAFWAGVPTRAAANAAPDTAGKVADFTAPVNSEQVTYALSIESAATLPQATAVPYSHKQYFIVVGNF